ncbi:MAG: AAA family ATPase [Flavobacteriales bacterium]|nr:AAA family ATPase [Flavobacteriales bacterium]
MSPNKALYKEIDLKVYASTEWLADNKKKYRSVFELGECTYIYCEFSFINLKFLDKDWDLNLRIVCLDNENNEICNLNCDRIVSKNESVVYVREGWGTKNKGTFWKTGIFKWQAIVDEKLILEKQFYIQNFGAVEHSGAPYFEVETIKLYEGPDANVKINDRNYYSVFNYNYTRYVWVEFNAKNLIKDVNYWTCELTFNFRTSNQLLKGSITKLFFVYPQDNEFSITIGWGSDKVGTWGRDIYSIDVLFMDKLLFTKEFEIGDDYMDATEEDFKVENFRDLLENPENEDSDLFFEKEDQDEDEEGKVHDREESVDVIMKELEGLIGLGEIKNKIKEYSNYLSFISLRKNKGLKEKEKINLSAIFRGNPGTGKTTVARKLGKIYHNLGLLSKGHVFEVDRGDLVAEFIGQTAPKTKAALKKAKGGILFIDEAYSLARKDDDAKDFGKEVIEILLKELSDNEDIAIICAGYPAEMDNFLESNPGLKSRFTMFYDFPDYVPQELLEIAHYACEKRGIALDKKAEGLLYKSLVEAYRGRDKFFGNARLVNSMIDECKLNLGLRVMSMPNPEKLTPDELSLITVEDVEKLSLKKQGSIADIPIDEELLKESIDKISHMIGLESVKEDIKDLVKLVRFYKETGKDVKQAFSLHTVFTGNPGTGKTTVARILAQIYKALGILERGHLIECDRQSLVGGYVGQTAIKTAEIIDRAMGGVLFIDEAYSLTEGGQSDFGKEAIEILLKRMEDHRGNFIVIAAGYTDNMKRFIESNPGLKSRFDRTFHFEDFKSEELLEIAYNQLKENNLEPDKEASVELKRILDLMYSGRDKFFGNGRAVRKMVEEVVRHQHLRMSEIPSSKRTGKITSTLTTEDLKEINLDEIIQKTKISGIGFRQGS